MNYDQDQTLSELDQAYDVGGELLTKEQYEAHRKEQLQELYKLFSGQRDEWVKHRANSGVETRWRNAQALYLGDESVSADSAFVDSLKNGPSPRNNKSQGSRSKVVINIVRPKVDQAIARMCEILLPVDDKNWSIKPTPVPEAVNKMIGNMAEMVGPDGQPTGKTADAEAQAIIKRMKACAEKMADEIDDVLTECEYNGEQRKAIEDGVKLGTGMLLGPFPNNAAKRSWIPQPDGTMQLSISNEVKPATMRADPWDVWTDPACGNDHQRGQGFYHRRYATRKELRALVGIPGYDADCIREILRGKPTRLKVAEGRIMREACDEDSYELWVYYGQVEPDQMEMLSESMGDPLTDVVNGVIIMVGDQVIGAMELWIPDGSLPLDVWCWRKADDSPCGYGLCDELGHQQRVVNAAWRQVMDDAKLSIGGQLIMKKKQIIPQDGNYELYPGKVWLANEEMDDVRQAMFMFEFQNHAQQLLQIATSAMQFADQETSMPQLLSGEKGNAAPETLGGMQMLFNNAQTVLRLRVKLYDDAVTRPHIRRHFDWQMANSTKAEIKGDMEVDARGSTALLEKDIQNQATINLASITSNPRYAAFLDPKEELKLLLKAFKTNPQDVMLTDAAIEANQQRMAQNPPPADPRIESAKLMLEGKKMDIEARREKAASDAEMQQAELAVKRESIAYNTERERGESQQKMIEAQLERELAIAKMQQDGILTQEELASKERLQAIQLDQKAQLFNAEAALRVNTGEGI